MADAHLNAEELSRRIGIPASTIKKIRNNNDSNPTLSTLSPLAKYFSLTISQLVGDEPFPDSRIKGSYKLTQETLYHFPLITWEETITWPSAKIIPKHSVTTEHKYGKNAYALLVEEDNWENLAKNTALLVDPTLKPEHRDFVIVHKSGQKKPTLKQILLDEGNIYLKSVTQGIGITALTENHNIFGIVVEYKKYLKN